MSNLIFLCCRDLLISSPPVAVVQTYVSCVLDAADATLNSLGIASGLSWNMNFRVVLDDFLWIGNAQIAAPIILMCLFIIIYVMEQLHLFPKLSQRRRYTVDDYRDILDEFGQCLLDAKNREIGLSKESDGVRRISHCDISDMQIFFFVGVERMCP